MIIIIININIIISCIINFSEKNIYNYVTLFFFVLHLQDSFTLIQFLYEYICREKIIDIQCRFNFIINLTSVIIFHRI